MTKKQVKRIGSRIRNAMKTTFDPIESGRVKFIISSLGDPSVGIPGSDAEVTMYVGTGPNDLYDTREMLRTAFAEMFDDQRTVVQTEGEVARYERLAEEADKAEEEYSKNFAD